MDLEKNNQSNDDNNCRVDPELDVAADVESLQQALAEEQEKATANLAGWQRAQADFANYKRRAEKERQDTSRFANQCLVLELLPVLDDLERALAAVPEELAEDGWTDGIRLIGRKLWAKLEAQGLEPIAAVGEKFDPHYHEAVMQAKGEEDVIIEEIQKGYRLHDRVIRPSKVVVGSGEMDDNQQGGEA